LSYPSFLSVILIVETTLFRISHKVSITIPEIFTYAACELIYLTKYLINHSIHIIFLAHYFPKFNFSFFLTLFISLYLTLFAFLL